MTSLPAWRDAWLPLLLALGCAALVVLLRQSGTLELLELSAWNRAISQQTPSTTPARTLLVTIGEEEYSRYGYPIPDSHLAAALQRLVDGQAAAVGVDLYRNTPIRDTRLAATTPDPGYAQLQAVQRSQTHIYWIMLLGGATTPAVPGPSGLPPKQLGFNDLLPDPDEALRRTPLYITRGDDTYKSLGLRLALATLKARGIREAADPAREDWLRLGAHTLPPLERHHGGYRTIDAGGYQIMLDYAQRPADLPRVTLRALLDGEVAAGQIAGRMVLLGTIAPSVKDHFENPLHQLGPRHRVVHGVEYHALVANQLVRLALGEARPWQFPGEAPQLGAILALALLAMALAWRLGTRPWGLLLGLGGGAALLWFGFHAAIAQRIWWPVVAPLIAWIGSGGAVAAYRGIREYRQRQAVMRLFAQHVSPAVAQQAWEHRDTLLRGGRIAPQQLTATVLFTDLEGFTSISERLGPETLITWLNEYMEAMSNVIRDHGGVINKYIGDAIMAVYGVPVARTTPEAIQADALSAVRSAQAMGRALDALNQQWTARGLPPVRMRVGINTGPLVAGSLGARDRLEYTVLGDTVNIASRLESFDKTVGSGQVCRVLVSDPTWQQVGSVCHGQALGQLHLKGKAESVTVWMIRDPAASTQEQDA